MTGQGGDGAAQGDGAGNGGRNDGERGNGGGRGNGDGHGGGRGDLIMVVLALCGTIVSLQQTMIIPLLPELPALIGTTADTASWLVTATLLAGAVATPVISRLADIHGKRRLIVVSLSIMVAGSALGALVHDVGALILARAMQGIGLALVPVGLAMMRDVLPPRRLPLGVSLMSATLAIGAGVGLPLGGWVAQNIVWFAVFWATAILGATLLVLCVWLVPRTGAAGHGRFDLPGAILLSIALTAFLLTLSKGGQWGWSSPLVVGLVITGMAATAVWLPLAWRSPAPLIDLRTSLRPSVALVNACAVLMGFGMFANMLVTTQILQLPTDDGMGMSTLESGLWMAPSALVFGVFAPVSAWITRRFGAAVTLLVGSGTMAVFYVLRVVFDGSLAEVVAGSVLVSAGTSLAFGAMPVLIMAAVPVSETSAANGLNTLLRSVGTSTSSAVLAAVSVVSTVTVGGVVYAGPGASDAMFWMAAGASTVAAAATLPLLAQGRR